LHPILPEQWTSRAVRVTMSQDDWSRFESLARSLAPAVPTQARAYGLALCSLLHSANLPNRQPGPLDWMDWERRKILRLLLPDRA
jgi:hypothetical protein